MTVNISYYIDDRMAWLCIEHLLNRGERVSKRRILEICKIHLYREGALFETEPQFDEKLETKKVSEDRVNEVFSVVWGN